MKNCYTWAREQVAYHGGKWILTWSDHWFGHFHVVYVDKGGSLWGYDPDDKGYVSMWRFLCDGEWVFQGHAEQYDDRVLFLDGLKAKILGWLR